MKKIKLAQGRYAIVDDEDFERLNSIRWFFDGNYAARKSPKKIYMHRIVNDTPDELQTDHINRDKLDNRRKNLRIVTPRQNILNKGIRSDNQTGMTGVFFRSDRNRWIAYINNYGKRKYLGYFTSVEEALEARMAAETTQ